jgi:hypothetical protein
MFQVLQAQLMQVGGLVSAGLQIPQVRQGFFGCGYQGVLSAVLGLCSAVVR